MKKIIVLFSFLMLVKSIQAQKFGELDKSPMDMAYYPDNFAHDRKFAPKLIGDTPALVRVTYSRPAKKGREVFGKLIPFNEVWRAGANEATEIKFYKDVTIQGKSIPAGSYALFIIPMATEWTIILNKDLDHWGAYSYNLANDVLRATVPVTKSESIIENFTIQLTKRSDKEATLRFGWDTTLVEIPISF